MSEMWRPDRTNPPLRSLRAPQSLWNDRYAPPAPVRIYDALGQFVREVAPIVFLAVGERCPLHGIIRCWACDDWKRSAAIKARRVKAANGARVSLARAT